MGHIIELLQALIFVLGAVIVILGYTWIKNKYKK